MAIQEARYGVTFLGREFLAQVAPFLGRVGQWEVAEFQKEWAASRQFFARLGTKAGEQPLIEECRLAKLLEAAKPVPDDGGMVPSAKLSPPAALILSAAADTFSQVRERFGFLGKALRPIPDNDHHDGNWTLTAAILALEEGTTPTQTMAKWTVLKDRIASFAPKETASLAALLAIHFSPEEAMAHLKLAATALAGTGGLNDMNLALKLLLLTVLQPNLSDRPKLLQPILPDSGYQTHVRPVLLAIASDLHARTLPGLAEAVPSFHPVHTHYTYG